MSSNEKQTQPQQQNTTNSIHLRESSSPYKPDNNSHTQTNPTTNQFSSLNQTNSPEVPYDWQKYLMERKDYLGQTNPNINSFNIQSQSNGYYTNADRNTNQAKGVYTPVYGDQSRNPANFNSNITKLNNSGILESLGNNNNNNALITSVPSNPQQNVNSLLEERNKEIRELKEILNFINTENTTNKMLMLKFTEENTKMLIEINQLKQNQSNNNNNNNSNTASLEAKLKQLEQENQNLNKELSTKADCLESSNKKVADLQNELNKKSNNESNSRGELTEEKIKNSHPYAELNFKFEKLQEERNNLKSYTSELQTLYGEIIEDYKALRPKAAEAQKLEKELGAARLELASATSAKEALEAKTRELELSAESAKGKNNILKVEKESLVETINRLNKEIEELKSQVEAKQHGKNNGVSFSNNLSNNNNNNNNVNLSSNNFNNGNFNSNNNNVSALNANANATAVNDLPELFKLELEEKEKAIQILQCSLEERDKIIEQFKNEQGKMISRNKTSHHDLINTIEDLKFKIISLESEINEKNNFISLHNNEFNLKKLETENLNLENKQLKDQINLFPALKGEIENLKAQLKKQISQTDELRDQINSKESRVIMLEKTVSALKNELDEKETQLTLTTEECNTTKLYEKKRDIIHSTLLDIRDLKEKISKDKHNLSIAFNTTPNNIFTDYSRDLTENNINFNYNSNSNFNYANNNINSLLKSADIEPVSPAHQVINSNANNNSNLNNFNNYNAYNNNNSNNNNYNQNAYSRNRHQPIEEATPRTEGLESYRKITEEDILFFQNAFKNFDLNLLTEFDFLLNSKNWNLISTWLPALNEQHSKKSTNSGRSNTKSNTNSHSNSMKSFKLKLLFKASKDGFSHLDFKEKCAGKPNTLVLAVTNFDKIIGGFTPLPWENVDEHVYVKDDSEKSFIFSVNCKQKLRIINADHAICLSPDCGPIFGGGSDLEIVDHCNVHYNNFFRVGHSYEYDDTPESFFGGRKYLIRDYEVYEVFEC